MWYASNQEPFLFFCVLSNFPIILVQAQPAFYYLNRIEDYDTSSVLNMQGEDSMGRYMMQSWGILPSVWVIHLHQLDSCPDSISYLILDK